MSTILESRQRSAANELRSIVGEIEGFLSRDDADTEGSEYVALRESREAAEAHLADITANLAARRLAEAPAPPVLVNGEQVSAFRRVLREYGPGGRGHSEKVDIPYSVLRELQTGDPYFTNAPTRIQVAQLPVITPSLDSINAVQVGGNAYDFVVPTAVVLADTVAEGAKKNTRTWAASKVSGTLQTQAHIVDTTRQTLEDDANAETTLRAWLSDGVRAKQDAEAAAAIAGATGTLTATGATLLGAIRAGKAKLSGAGVQATAVHIHPDDAAAIDLEAMASGHTGPEGVPVVFGMTVVENPAIGVGTPLVGALKQAVYFLYRASVQTYLTDSGMTDEATPRDRFSHNLIGILAEGRSRTHVVSPTLLVKVSVAPLARAGK